MPSRILDEPSNVSAEQGKVIVDGPDGVAITLSPRAAEATAERLREAAILARRQRDETPPPPESYCGT